MPKFFPDLFSSTRSGASGVLEASAQILLYFLCMTPSSLSVQAKETVEKATLAYDRFLQELGALREERFRLYERAVKEIELARTDRLRKKISASV